MSKICSIHQVNFCPYAGIFQKIAQSDIFVMMAHCQFTKNNFQSRFNYKEHWYTMRVNQSHEPIINKYYKHAKEDWDMITAKLPKLKVFDDCVDNHLASMNIGIIKKAVELLNIKTRLKGDYETKLTGTERLIDICGYYNADTYLSGVSGTKYLEMDKFEQAGIKVVFQSNPDKRALEELL